MFKRTSQGERFSPANYFTLGLSCPREKLRQPYPRKRWRYVPDIRAPVGADALRWYLSGAASDGGAQTSVTSCLGGYRSSTEADRCGWLLTSPIDGITIQQVAHKNLDDNPWGSVSGSLVAPGVSSLRYTAPGSSTPGEAVTIENGETKTLIDGEDSSQWIRVTRTSSDSLIGAATLEIHEQYNNAFGFNDSGNSESVAGSDRYRALFLRSVVVDPITALQLYIQPLGATVTGASVVLGGAGSGTITLATDACLNWPRKGWCHIQTSGGATREIVYYASRTSNVLTVPSLGRGRLGTSAAAGNTGDSFTPVPGIRIGWEAASPILGGSVQSIASETTAPTGLTWSTGFTAATGLQVGTLSLNHQGAVWIHRELPAGVGALPYVPIRIGAAFRVVANSYGEIGAGLHRIAVDAVAQYELFVGSDAYPDVTGAPTATSATLPITHSLAAGHTYYLATQYRNKYDLASEAMDFTVLPINGSGTQINPAPSAPRVIDWSAYGGGFRLRAVYYQASDGSYPADQWQLGVTYDGSSPTFGSPTNVSIGATPEGVAYLEWTSPTQVAGVVGKVIVRVKRTSDSQTSASSSIYTATASDVTSAGTGRIVYRGIAEER